MKRKVKSMGGVEIHTTKDGTAVVYVRYQANGKQYREKIGPDQTYAEAGKPGPQRKSWTVDEAKRILKERRADIRDARLRDEVWLSPTERRKAAEIEAEHQAAQLETERAALLWKTRPTDG